MHLPGGLHTEGRLRRDYHFQPLNGTAEMTIAETSASAESLPEKVTAVLASTLHDVAGADSTARIVDDLCVADRQYLMRQLAITLGLDELWLTATCGECGAVFDVRIIHSHIPVKPAGDGFPFSTAATSVGQLRVRCPTGGDQKAICALADDSTAERTLLRRCIVGTADSPALDRVNLDALTAQDIAAVSGALESVSPELAVSAYVACPQCNLTNNVDVDPYICLRAQRNEIHQEVHRLASAYGWSEGEILALPRRRRKLYLALLDSARGMVS